MTEALKTEALVTKALNCIYTLCGEKLPVDQTTYGGGLGDLCMKHRELAEFILFLIPRIQVTRQPQIIVPQLGVRQ